MCRRCWYGVGCGCEVAEERTLLILIGNQETARLLEQASTSTG